MQNNWGFGDAMSYGALARIYSGKDMASHADLATQIAQIKEIARACRDEAGNKLKSATWESFSDYKKGPIELMGYISRLPEDRQVRIFGDLPAHLGRQLIHQIVDRPGAPVSDECIRVGEKWAKPIDESLREELTALRIKHSPVREQPASDYSSPDYRPAIT